MRYMFAYKISTLTRLNINAFHVQVADIRLFLHARVQNEPLTNEQSQALIRTHKMPTRRLFQMHQRN